MDLGSSRGKGATTPSMMMQNAMTVAKMTKPTEGFILIGFFAFGNCKIENVNLSLYSKNGARQDKVGLVYLLIKKWSTD